ncbi:MAG: hypothetical protein QF682_11305, partial [Candidatus Thermoplasmatota archaeon]|nr:hypothetical protein [Candidatus Thermoplasmatota archaeon]
ILGFGETRFSITCRKPQVFEGVAEPGGLRSIADTLGNCGFLRESRFDKLIILDEIKDLSGMTSCYLS